MTRRSIKKIILPNLPYLFIALFATKLPQAWRLAAGADASEKLLHLLGSLAGAFRSPLPSFHPLAVYKRQTAVAVLAGCIMPPNLFGHTMSGLHIRQAAVAGVASSRDPFHEL